MPSTSPTPMVRPLHLAAAVNAAGCLRAACASGAMPGAVIGFFGDLAHGPLDDGQARAAFLRARVDGHGGARIDRPLALFPEWQTVVERLDREHPDGVIVWGGDNVADATFVAMACDRLAGRREPLWRVTVPGVGGRPYVATHSPEQLARLYATRRPLSAAERLSLARDFARIRDTCGPVRRWERGRVVGVPVDFYDPLLLAACGPEWRVAARVVGTAMGSCDGPNLMGEAYFSERLDALVDAGRVEASGRRKALRDYSVRLAER